MTRYTFAPNVGPADLQEAIAHPSRWRTPNCNALQLESWHFLAGAPPNWMGPNAWPAVREVGLGHLKKQGISLTIAAGAIKEHDPTGERLLKAFLGEVRPNVEQSGGKISMIALDDPLSSSMQGRYTPDGRSYPYRDDQLGLLTDRLADWINRVNLPCRLMEAWPQHPAERIIQELMLTKAKTNGLVAFEMDVDENAIRIGDNLPGAISRLRAACDTLGIEFGIICTGMLLPGGNIHYNDETWSRSAFDFASRHIPTDTPHVTVMSWHENPHREVTKDMPSCLGSFSLGDVLSTLDQGEVMEHPEASDFRLWAKQSRADMGDVLGIPHKQVTNIEGVGNLMYHRYLGKTRAETKQIFIDNQPVPDPEPDPPTVDPSMTFVGTYLYSGNHETEGRTDFWLAASQYVSSWSPQTQHLYNATQDGNNTIVVAFNTGYRKELQEIPFSCLNGEVGRKAALGAIDQANRDGLAVWAYLLTQEYGEQSLGLGSGSWDGISEGKFEDLLDVIGRTMTLLKGRVPVVTPFREIGDKFSGKSLRRRNLIFRAIREVDPDVAIACHERSREGVPVSDFDGVSEPTISALQTGFGATVAEASAFLKENVERMKAKRPGHRVGLFEMHIPPKVYSSRVTSTSLERARQESRQVVEHSGAAFDMNGGTKVL